MRVVLTTLWLLTGLLAQDPPPIAKPAAPPIAGTADLDEKSFAALHDLKQEQPPKPTGKMVQVGEQKHYVALPKDPKVPLPAIVVIHEWWGLNDHVKHWADRLAADGYAALAVDLYGGAPATTREEAQAAMAKVDAEQARATLRAAVEFLASDERIKATRIASLGWCFGGAWSLQLAIAEPRLTACVLYYGRLVEDEAQLAKIQAPVLGVFGTRDRSIPEARIAAFEAVMQKAKKGVRVLRYDAEHAFANPSGARYDQQHAAAAWVEVRAFLKAHSVEPANQAVPGKDAGK